MSKGTRHSGSRINFFQSRKSQEKSSLVCLHPQTGPEKKLGIGKILPSKYTQTKLALIWKKLMDATLTLPATPTSTRGHAGKMTSLYTPTRSGGRSWEQSGFLTALFLCIHNQCRREKVIVRFIARVFLTIPFRTSSFPADVRHQLVNFSSCKHFNLLCSVFV